MRPALIALCSCALCALFSAVEAVRGGTYYSILSVRTDASPHDIRKAYKKAALYALGPLAVPNVALKSLTGVQQWVRNRGACCPDTSLQTPLSCSQTF